MGGTSARSIGKYRFHRVKTAFELSINQYCRSKNGKLISRVQCMFFFLNRGPFELLCLGMFLRHFVPGLNI